MTDDQVRRLNAELGLPSASAERWLHDLRADERREEQKWRCVFNDWRHWEGEIEMFNAPVTPWRVPLC